MGISLVRHNNRVLAVAIPCLALVACMSGSRAREPAPLPANQVGRPVLSDAGQATSLQASIMALTDTAVQRIGAGVQIARQDRTPEQRRDDNNTRLLLATALISIAIEPDPVDSLADLLTHTTLTADAQRNAAEGKAADNPEAILLTVLEQNAADAWQLADRWLNEPTRAALREHILAWKGPRTSATSVAFVRLSDFKRAGSESVESGEGVFDTLHAATEQADQTRLLAERSIFLIQRMPFLLRWQAELYTANALATKEAQQTQVQLERMSEMTLAMSQAIAGMSGQLSRERQAALEDLFGHVATERSATLEQVMRIVQQERKTTLKEAGAEVDRQREALLKDVLKITDVAGRTGSAWIGRTLLVGGILIAVLLVGLLGVMLLYRRLVPAIERRALRSTAARPQ